MTNFKSKLLIMPCKEKKLSNSQNNGLTKCSHLIVEAEDGDFPPDHDLRYDLLGAVESFAGLSFDYSAAAGPPVSIRTKRTLLVLRKKDV